MTLPRVAPGEMLSDGDLINSGLGHLHRPAAILALDEACLVASATAWAGVGVFTCSDDVHVNVAFEKAHRDCFHGNPLSSHHRATLSRWWLPFATLHDDLWAQAGDTAPLHALALRVMFTDEWARDSCGRAA